MLHEIGRELEARLLAKGCPFKVYDRESTAPTTWARNRVVVEHDDSGSDSFAAGQKGQSRNPKNRYVRSYGIKITIYAQSSANGAREFEHRRLAEKALDHVLVAMDYVAAVRLNEWLPKGGKWIRIADLEKSEVHGGAVYELTATFDRGVAERTWAGAIRPATDLRSGTVASSTRVSLRRGPDDDDDPNTVPAAAETACGA